MTSATAGAGLILADPAAPSARSSDTLSSSSPPRRKTPFIDARDGTSLFYRDWGTGKPAVFVAPWALNSDWWEYQMTHLADRGVRALAYDRRGHGRSGQPAFGYDFDALADDLAAVIEGLDLRDVTLVGHSMGAGEVVRYLSRHHARRVARIVLVAPIGPLTLRTADNPDGVERSDLEKSRASLGKDRPGNIAKAAAAFFGAEKNSVSPAMLEWWTSMILHQCSLKVMLDLHRVFTETDFRPDLRTITVPTLIIHGDSDTSTPLDFTGRRMAALIRGSQLKVYEGAAHGLPITHMDALNRDLLAFIGD
jgi:pimeloyl-ACP methyl ester carboxylesterase